MTDQPAHPEPSPAAAARKVELIVAQLDSLPTLPQVASQLLRLTRSDQSTSRQVIELVKQDQAVTAKILSLARRAGSGIRDEVTTVDKCVLLLGLEAVRNAALSIKIFEIFDPAGDTGAGEFDLIEFWKHSLAVALAAEKLGTLLPEPRPGWQRPSPEDLFVAGLLHDIGKAALHHCLPKSYAKVIEAAELTHGPLVAIERKLIGIDHTLVGKRLAQRWMLPQAVIDSIWLHQGPPAALPESVARRGIVQIVHLADLLVRELRLGYSGNHARASTAESAAAAIGINAGKLDEVRRWLPNELAGRASLIGIDQIDSRDLYHDALKQANEELASLNSKLLDRTAKLIAKAKCFDLLGRLAQTVRPNARPIELAETIARLLSGSVFAGRLVVFSESPDRDCCRGGESSSSERCVEGVVFEPSDDSIERFILQASEDVESLSSARAAGGFEPQAAIGQPDSFALYPLSGRLGWVHSNLVKSMPLTGACLMPLLAEGRWVGGAVFLQSAEADVLSASWPRNRDELAAVASAAGLAMRSAQAAAAAEQLAEELTHSAENCARLQDQLIRERALASVGLMAAGAGHELNNPLMVISGRSELLAADEPDPTRREALEQIRSNAQRASEIISEMMDFAKPPPAQPARVDLADLGRRLAEPFAASGINVDIQAQPDLPAAWVDPAQLREVVQEILDNAQQAMAAQDTNRTLTLKIAAAPGDDMLELVIVDTGVGMEPTVLERATEPFFSARPAGRGRGLGLARSRRLLEHNGGRIEIDSAPGAGTTVRLFIPAARA